MSFRWNITVNTRYGEKTGFFYYSDKIPLLNILKDLIYP